MQSVFPSVPLLAPLVLVIAALDATAAEQSEEASPAKAQVVEFSLAGISQEEPPQQTPFGPAGQNFRGRLEVLRELAADPEIEGLRLKLNGSLDYARSLDLLHELRAVKAAGKKLVFFAETLSQKDLMYASLADLLMVAPSGMVTLEPLTMEVMYLRDLLAKLNARVEVIHIGEYKTAFEDLARESMSDQQRESMQEFMGEFYQQIIKTVAQQRGMDRAAVEAGFEQVFLDPAEAKALGFIDAIGYEDEFDSRLEEMFGSSIEVLDDYGEPEKPDFEKMFSNPMALFTMLPKLLEPTKPELPPGPRVAIVYCSGPIHSGKSTQAFGGGVTMGSETIVEALEATLEDDDIKAVILRVNSPGGSAIASDAIWRAVERVQEKKPVVASMGSVAASGGYWISMGCDKIVAQPSTLTGSIGVVTALPDLSEMFRKMGIKVEIVGVGPHVEDLALLRDGPSPFLKDTIRSMMVSTYDMFIRKVAEGRGLDPQVVRQHAEGRVWTGRRAHEIGLVDGLGGLDDAMVLACYLADGLPVETTPVVEFPERPSFFEQLEEMFEGVAQLRLQPLSTALQLIGAEDALAMASLLGADRRPLDPERVQALLPFWYRVR